MDRIIGIAVGLAFLAAAHWWLGRYCYRYFTTYFAMPNWLALILSAGGIVTYVFYVMLDEFTHTSMAGENSRAWKNDPERDVYIIPWSEAKNLVPLEYGDETDNWDGDEMEEWEDWSRVDYDRLMCLVYNLHFNQKRLARRVIQLENALNLSPADLREYVLREAVGLLQGKVNAELIWKQTCQHPHHAEASAAALTRLFGNTLGPLAPPEPDEEWVGF